MCSKSSDKLIARLKKNSIKYLFSIFKFRYLFRQQSKPDETSPTVLIFLMIKVCNKECFKHLYSVLLFSGYTHRQIRTVLKRQAWAPN
nr:MAG TPA: hypothetical protein [Caudoviricetes sp.]